ncbi:hypothetical protein ABES08_19760 [Peribacillus simplex]|uniref:hypothetical protein n=1 Tax=Peribacillus simplex TaxID=1478 RepID=UPI003D2E46C6
MKGVCEYSKTKINGKILKEKQTQSFTMDMILALAIIFANGYEAQEEVKDKMLLFSDICHRNKSNGLMIG